MLAETARCSWHCLLGSISAGSTWPNQRVLGSRTSTAAGSPAALGSGTWKVSPSKRARGCGASMSAQRAVTEPALLHACATPMGSSP